MKLLHYTLLPLMAVSTTSALPSNDTFAASNIINAALASRTFIQHVPHGDVTCLPSNPQHAFARSNSIVRHAIPRLAQGRLAVCDVRPAGRVPAALVAQVDERGCERVWCRGHSAVYVCPQRNAAAIHLACVNVAEYVLAIVAQCGEGGGVMGAAWDAQRRFTVEVGSAECRPPVSGVGPPLWQGRMW